LRHRYDFKAEPPSNQLEHIQNNIIGNKSLKEDSIAISREAKKSPEISLRAFVFAAA
jgi:hypothetical protein